MLFEVVVDVSDGNDPWIFWRIFVRLFVLVLVPVEDPAHKRRQQEGFGLGTSDSLDQMEDQGHVALDFLFREGLTGFYSFPSWGDLDQNPRRIDAHAFVQFYDPLGPFDGFILVKGKFSVNLCGHDTRDFFEDVGAEGNGQVVEDQVN